MLAAICFGAVFGVPFIIMGAILIFDRDRSWRRVQQRATAPQRRSPAWDRRQILYGCLLICLGSFLLVALGVFNYLAQGISPPSPF